MFNLSGSSCSKHVYLGREFINLRCKSTKCLRTKPSIYFSSLNPCMRKGMVGGWITYRKYVHTSPIYSNTITKTLQIWTLLPKQYYLFTFYKSLFVTMDQNSLSSSKTKTKKLRIKKGKDKGKSLITKPRDWKRISLVTLKILILEYLILH